LFSGAVIATCSVMLFVYLVTKDVDVGISYFVNFVSLKSKKAIR